MQHENGVPAAAQKSPIDLEVQRLAVLDRDIAETARAREARRQRWKWANYGILGGTLALSAATGLTVFMEALPPEGSGFLAFASTAAAGLGAKLAPQQRAAVARRFRGDWKVLADDSAALVGDARGHTPKQLAAKREELRSRRNALIKEEDASG
ncbi:hypothetical protein [Ornithinimicrobium avium]|uniref:SLATT domain-containing protein n=1 Tax=Ornithinimicrobium avium TaxID=2283195 RepID=A0A345NQS0_9MICO|nr:hypothetical protein [Ornithinimicrobium avium]AXH97378.1 hypothetical protein DV701_15785 [Ornithinimicrobium avium]